jgi:hypothetical protein
VYRPAQKKQRMGNRCSCGPVRKQKEIRECHAYRVGKPNKGSEKVIKSHSFAGFLSLRIERSRGNSPKLAETATLR